MEEAFRDSLKMSKSCYLLKNLLMSQISYF